MLRLLPLLPALMLPSCAPHPETGEPAAPPALPTAAEVAGYVAEHWNDEWRLLFARFAGHAGEEAILVKVEKVSCEYLYVTPQCRFEVTGRFATGIESTQPMFSQFDRESDGKLESVVVMYETRPHR